MKFVSKTRRGPGPAHIRRCSSYPRRIAATLALAALVQVGIAETPVSSDSIADSVGINVHLHYTDTPYANFALVQSLLTELHVRHIRDGLVDTTWEEFYKRHNALGELGIHCVYVTSPKQTETLLATYPSRVQADFEGYEAPNEYNNSGDPHWVETLDTFVPMLYRITKTNPRVDSRAIVIGPSLTQPDAFAKLSKLQTSFDYANLHNYLAGRNPGTPGWGGGGYGSIKWNIDLANSAWRDKQIMTTEIGYTTDPQNKQSIPEEVEGRYMPRLILEQFLHHIRRTYIYELIDVGRKVSENDAAFGLVHNDGSRKPAYLALKNLVGLTIDSGSTPTLRDLPIELSGDMSNVHHLLAQRRDGSYLLFVWIEEQSYDPNSHKLQSVAPKTITLHSPIKFRTLQMTSFSSTGNTSTQNLKATGPVPLTITDALSVVRLVPAGTR